MKNQDDKCLICSCTSYENLVQVMNKILPSMEMKCGLELWMLISGGYENGDQLLKHTSANVRNINVGARAKELEKGSNEKLNDFLDIVTQIIVQIKKIQQTQQNIVDREQPNVNNFKVDNIFQQNTVQVKVEKLNLLFTNQKLLNNQNVLAWIDTMKQTINGSEVTDQEKSNYIYQIRLVDSQQIDDTEEEIYDNSDIDHLKNDPNVVFIFNYHQSEASDEQKQQHLTEECDTSFQQISSTGIKVQYSPKQDKHNPSSLNDSPCSSTSTQASFSVISENQIKFKQIKGVMIPDMFDLSMEQDPEIYLSIGSQDKLLNIVDIIVNGEDSFKYIFRNQKNFANIYKVLSAQNNAISYDIKMKGSNLLVNQMIKLFNQFLHNPNTYFEAILIIKEDMIFNLKNSMMQIYGKDTQRETLKIIQMCLMLTKDSIGDGDLQGLQDFFGEKQFNNEFQKVWQLVQGYTHKIGLEMTENIADEFANSMKRNIISNVVQTE